MQHRFVAAGTDDRGFGIIRNDGPSQAAVKLEGPAVSGGKNPKVLLERQYRYAAQAELWELPAGKIDAGESPLRSAKRELLEETGYTATDWQFVCTIHNAIAYADEHLDIYLARGLTEGQRKLDEEEFLDVFKASIDDLLAWVKEGKVTDVKTIIGAFWLEKIQANAWQL